MCQSDVVLACLSKFFAPERPKKFLREKHMACSSFLCSQKLCLSKIVMSSFVTFFFLSIF